MLKIKFMDFLSRHLLILILVSLMKCVKRCLTFYASLFIIYISTKLCTTSSFSWSKPSNEDDDKFDEKTKENKKTEIPIGTIAKSYFIMANRERTNNSHPTRVKECDDKSRRFLVGSNGK